MLISKTNFVYRTIGAHILTISLSLKSSIGFLYWNNLTGWSFDSSTSSRSESEPIFIFPTLILICFFAKNIHFLSKLQFNRYHKITFKGNLKLTLIKNKKTKNSFPLMDFHTFYSFRKKGKQNNKTLSILWNGFSILKLYDRPANWRGLDLHFGQKNNVICNDGSNISLITSFITH